MIFFFFLPASNELLATVQKAAEGLHQNCIKTNELALRPSALAGPWMLDFGCRARLFAGRCACWDIGGLPSRAGILLPRVRAPLESSRAGQGAGEGEEGTSDPWGRVGEGRQTGPIERSSPTGGERPEKARRRRGAEEENRQEKQDQPSTEENRWRQKKPEQTAQDPRRPSRPGRKGPGRQQRTARPLVRRQGPQDSALRQRPWVAPHETPGRASATSPWRHGLLRRRSGLPAVGSRGHSRPALCGLGLGVRGLRSLRPTV